VDYGLRQGLLAELRREAEKDAASLAQTLLAAPADGRIKLFVTHRALELRRARADVFEAGAYSPLSVLGSRRRHVIAFARGEGSRSVIAIAGRFFSELTADGRPPLGRAAWEDTRVSLQGLWPGAHPIPAFKDTLTGRVLEAAGEGGTPALELSRVLSHLPLALLEAVE
jgi:(1->4)-alpha-D-glucan 1-alpha-D-glucosylmutase